MAHWFDYSKLLIVLFGFSQVMGIGQESGSYIPKLIAAEGHKGSVNTAVFSPDEKYVVTATQEKIARIWDISSGKIVQILEGHAGYIQMASFSPDGKEVLTASVDGTAKIWNLRTGQVIMDLVGHNKAIRTAVYSKDGKMVVTAGQDSTVRIWNAKTGLLEKKIRHTGRLLSADFSADGQRILTSDLNNPPIIWDVSTGKQIMNLDGSYAVSSACYSRDGNFILTSNILFSPAIFTSNGKKLVDIQENGNDRAYTNHGREYKVNFATISPDSKYFVTSGDWSGLNIWKLETGEKVRDFPVTYAVNSAGFSPSGRYVVTAGDTGATEIWELSTGKKIQEFVSTYIPVRSIKFSPSSRQVVGTYEDNTVKTWNIESGNLNQVIIGKGNGLKTVDYSPDGKMIVTTARDGTPKVWSLKNGEVLLEVTEHSYEAFSAVFSPDGKYVMSSNGLEIIITDIESGNTHKRFDRFDLSIEEVTFSPGAKYIAATCYWKNYKQIKIIDPNSGNLIHLMDAELSSINSEAFSQDDIFLAAPSSNNPKSLAIWDLNSKNIVKEFKGHSSYIVQSQFTQEDSKIVSLDLLGTMIIWDFESGEQLLQIEELGRITSFDINNSGSILVTACQDGSVIYWDLTTGEKLAKFYTLKGNNWVTIHPSGLFDATQQAMEWMYYLVNMEVIELSQIKSRYWEPGLHQKIMKRETLKDIDHLQSLEMYPLVEANINSDKLSIHLKERNGGLGMIELLVENKPVKKILNTTEDSSFIIDLNELEKYFIRDSINELHIYTHNKEGWLKSSPYTLHYQPMGKKGEGQEGQILIETHDPNFYAIVVGTSDYTGEELDLSFSDQDAAFITQAVQQSSEILFPGKTHVKWFSTNSSHKSLEASKKNIKAAFNTFNNAKPEDILFIYFSGHGTTYGSDENQQFYYLTKDISSFQDLNDPALRDHYTISSNELTDWISLIPARKQVLIIDACSSGKLIDDFTKAKNIRDDQLVAMDRMKDRTGMYVLAGSAADKVSYEASRFGQGILTYSILRGIRKEALRDEKYVDVNELFQFALDKVPELARDVGGIQKPTVFYPTKAESFDIGIVNDSVDIQFAEVKPVFEYSSFLEKEIPYDVLELATCLDAQLSSYEINSKEIIFIPSRNVKNAYKLTGNYSLGNDGIVHVNCVILKDKVLIGRVEIEGHETAVDDLVNSLLVQAEKIVFPD